MNKYEIDKIARELTRLENLVDIYQEKGEDEKAAKNSYRIQGMKYVLSTIGYYINYDYDENDKIIVSLEEKD